MSAAVLWMLLWLGLGILVVQRRTLAIALLCAQSLVLGAFALHESIASHSGFLIAGGGLIARGILLPTLLALIVRDTRESRRVAGERHALPRFLLGLLTMSAVATLTPDFAFRSVADGKTAIALVALGALIAATRRPIVFQLIGFLVAENGVFLAGLSVAGGLPGIVEMALVLDLLLLLVVAGAFGTKIHERFGTSDTTVLRSLRD